MQVTTSVLLWALFTIAQTDGRPPEIGSSEVSRTDVTKEQVGDALQTTTKPQDVGSSRYRASSGRTRNIYDLNNNNNNYNNLNHSNFTPGIINNNIKFKSSRRSRLPINWINSDPITSTPIPLPQTKESVYKNSRIRNESRFIHTIRLNPSNSLYQDKPKTKIKTTLLNSTKSSSTATKLSTKNNYIVIKPNLSFTMINSTKTKPLRLSNNNRTNNNNHKVNKTSANNNKKYPIIKNPVISTVYLKNWPNDPLRNTQDLINYQKYTSPHPTYSNVKNSHVNNSNLKPDKPVLSNNDKLTLNSWSSSSNLTNYEDPLLQPSVQEIIKWLQIPPFSTHQNVVSDPTVGDTVSNTFKPSVDSIKPVLSYENSYVSNDESANDFHLPAPYLDKLENNPNILYTLDTFAVDEFPSPPETLSNKTETSITLADSSVASTDAPTESSMIQRPVFRPVSEITQNTVVHIINPLSKKPNVTVSEGQLSLKNNSKVPPNVHITFTSQNDSNSAETLKDTSVDNLCPTITINSITKVNNTIQSKQGCTDLNIIINSQLLSTHNFNGIAGGDGTGDDKHVDGDGSSVTSTFYPTEFDYLSSTSVTPSVTVQSDPDRNDLYDSAVVSDDSEPEGPYDVNQESNVLIGDSAPGETAFSDDVEGTGEAAEGAGPEVAGQVADSPSGIASGSEAVGQSSSGFAGSSLSSPARPGLPNLGNPLSNLPGAGGNQGGSNSGNGGSTSLANLDDDDYDDDDFEFSPSGLVESISNVFTYLTFLNPLNYGIFSLAAAPFAAFAAGLVGMSAIFFPWAFANGLNFARAADKVTILVRPSFEEFVKQSINHYQKFPEWKSKRKKRRR